MNIENKDPVIFETLALINSAASGFLFCGIIDDPVEKLSDISIKANPSLAHITSSSAKRLKCVAQIEDADRKSSTKSLSETASILLEVGLSNPSFSDVKKRSIG